MAGAVPYLLRTKATKRARNRQGAIASALDRIAAALRQLDRELEDVVRTSSAAGVGRPGPTGDPASTARSDRKRSTLRLSRISVRQGELLARQTALRRESAELEGAIAAREAARSGPDRRRGGRAQRQATARASRPCADDPKGAPRGDLGPELEHDWGLGLWGSPKGRGGGLKPLPTFADPLLDRLADIFRIPGLPHFMCAQVELQLAFEGLDAVVAGRDPAFDGLAFADALCDCEIDLAVADELMRGGRDKASRLRDLAEGRAVEGGGGDR